VEKTDAVRFKTAKQIEGMDDFPALPDYDDVIAEPDAFTRIKAYCESGNANGMLGIYRALPNRREQFITKLDVGEFDPELIKGRFGGGDFIIKAYDEHSKIRLNQRLSIEGAPIIESAAPAVPLGAAPAVDVGALVSAMQDSNAQLLAGLAQIMRPAPAPTRSEMLQEMAMMREMFAPAQQSSSDPMTMLLKGIELSRSLQSPATGEAGGMDVLLESIRAFAPAISTVVEQGVAQKNMARNQRPQQSQQPQQPQPQQPAIAPPINAQEDENMLLKYYLGILCGYAAQNRDTSLYADLIADNLNDDQLSALLNKTDVVGHLATLDSRVNDNRAWFESVVTELKTIVGLTEPENAATVLVVDTEKTVTDDQNNKPIA